jgi:xanthine dehydrogenase accessory factor
VQNDAVLKAALLDGAVLCTLIAVEGGFSRAPGAQLCVLPDGSVVGDMTGGCLEAALISDSRQAQQEMRNRRVRYGKGSRYIDIQLPCGGGVELYVDVAPDKRAIAKIVDALDRRQDAQLIVKMAEGSDNRPAEFVCRYQPPLRLLLFGHGPEVPALSKLATVWGCDVDVFEPKGAGQPSSCLTLGNAPVDLALDPYTAVVLLFHDHDWEDAILEWALKSEAFYVGALGGHKAIVRREEALRQRGLTALELKRLHGPVGLIPAAKDASMLAVSILAEVTQTYGMLCGRLE